jgi:nucleotide-binding universal stress UspA family protein
MQAIRTVLHATDFSKNSDFAFQLACSLARDYRALLVVVHVAEPVVPLYGDGVAIPPPVVSKESLLDKLRQMLPRDPRSRLSTGSPKEMPPLKSCAWLSKSSPTSL